VFWLQVEVDQLAADRESLEQTVTTLEESMAALTTRLDEARDRERLLLDYPDINGPVNPDLVGRCIAIKHHNPRFGLMVECLPHE